MSLAHRAIGLVVAAVATLAMVAGSRARITAEPSEDAMLRVAWSGRPERVERCRTLADEEVAALPAHMRQQVICEGTAARYFVEILRNGELLAADSIRGGGLRNDRQLYQFRELRVPSGPAAIEVRITRIDSATSPAEAEPGGSAARDSSSGGVRRELEERGRRTADAIPSSLILRDTITLAPREVLLVTYDRVTRRLRTMRGVP